MSRWPKRLPPLEPEQARINDDFMRYWHEVFPTRFGIADRWGHRYAVEHAPASFRRTLEVGAGIGEHLAFETLDPEQEREDHRLCRATPMAQGHITVAGGSIHRLSTT